MVWLFLRFPFLNKIAHFFLQFFNFKKDFRVNVKGHIMYANSLDRWAALQLWKRGLLENYETYLFKQIIKPGMTVVDVGANIGYYTLQFAEWVGPSGQVHAFEPDPQNFSHLKKSIEANQFKNVTAYPMAVSNKSGKTHFFISKANRGDHRLFSPNEDRPTIEIDTTRLDDLIKTKVDVIKMDIQGAELAALQGMENILRSNPGLVIISEFIPNLLQAAGGSADEFFDLINRHGFQAALVDEQKEKLITADRNLLIDACSTGKITSLFLQRHLPDNRF